MAEVFGKQWKMRIAVGFAGLELGDEWASKRRSIEVRGRCATDLDTYNDVSCVSRTPIAGPERGHTYRWTKDYWIS